MDALFPTGFPAPTAAYLALYVATWVLHVVFMHYVLAGSGYLLLRGLATGSRADDGLPSRFLKEWLPFMLSAAITAGIAPLLFVQIIYQHRFYTGNLLLFYRWLAILPALIVGFYLLYLLKANARILEQPLVRPLIKLVVFACFGYVAWLWTMNHLLSSQSLAVWTQQYAAGTVFYRSEDLFPRLGFWFSSAFPTLAAWLGWQVWLNRDDGQKLLADVATDTQARDVRHIAVIALVGLLASGLMAALYYSITPPSLRAVVTGPLAGPYLWGALIGGCIQAVAWIRLWTRSHVTAGRLWVITLALLVTLIGVAVVRESLRLGKMDIAVLYDEHEAAAQVAGRWTFVFFLVVNSALIIWCARIVTRGKRRMTEAATSDPSSPEHR
jgi:hypothetical protein